MRVKESCGQHNECSLPFPAPPPFSPAAGGAGGRSTSPVASRRVALRFDLTLLSRFTLYFAPQRPQPALYWTRTFCTRMIARLTRRRRLLCFQDDVDDHHGEDAALAPSACGAVADRVT